MTLLSPAERSAPISPSRNGVSRIPCYPCHVWLDLIGDWTDTALCKSRVQAIDFWRQSPRRDASGATDSFRPKGWRDLLSDTSCKVPANSATTTRAAATLQVNAADTALQLPWFVFTWRVLKARRYRGERCCMAMRGLQIADGGPGKQPARGTSG